MLTQISMPSTCQQIKTQYEALQRQKDVFKVAYDHVKTQEDLKQLKTLKKQLRKSVEGYYEKVDPFRIFLREKMAKKLGLDYIGPFSPKGIAPAQKGAEWVFVKKNGGILESYGTYREAGPFIDGVSLVNLHSSRFSYINEEGRYIGKGKNYFDAEPFSEGLGIVNPLIRPKSFIDREGKIHGSFQFITPYSNGFTMSRLAWNDKMYYRNKNGDVLKEIGGFKDGRDFSEDVFIVKEDDLTPWKGKKYTRGSDKKFIFL